MLFFQTSAPGCREADGVPDHTGEQQHVKVLSHSSHPLSDQRSGRSALAGLPGKHPHCLTTPAPASHPPLLLLLLLLFLLLSSFGSVTALFLSLLLHDELQFSSPSLCLCCVAFIDIPLSTSYEQHFIHSNRTEIMNLSLVLS